MTYKRLLWETTIVTFVIAVLCIAAMFGYAKYLPMIEQYELRAMDTEDGNAIVTEIKMQTCDTKSTTIPLAEGYSKTPMVRDNLLLKEVVLQNVFIDETKSMVSDPKFCSHIEMIKNKEQCSLKLSLEQAVNYSIQISSNLLMIQYDPKPAEEEVILILDPKTGTDESDIPLDIARLMQQQLQAEGLKVYLTRQDAQQASESARLEFVRSMQASVYLGIACQEESTIGIYNEKYFLRNYDNAQWTADILRSVTAVTKESMQLQKDASDNEILMGLTIPSGDIHLLNPKVNDEVQQVDWREVYCKTLAENMSRAILLSLREHSFITSTADDNSN